MAVMQTDDRQVAPQSTPVGLLTMPAERARTDHEPVLSIGDLVRELLRRTDPQQYGSVLERYAYPSHDLLPYLRWNQRHYTRTCVVRNDRFELLVVCFEPGQHTSIHDYDSEQAWVLPLMGEVIEERFRTTSEGLLRQESITHLSTGRMGSFTREGSIHRFSAPGPGRAITLNLYAPPTRQWRMYEEGTGASRLTAAGPPR